MKIELIDGLIHTAFRITYRGKSAWVANAVIDTGAAESVISPDAVEALSIFPEAEDEIVTLIGVGGSEHHSYSKFIDQITLGGNSFNNVKVDFGQIDPSGKINALIGLDLLIAMGAIINLKKLTIE